MDETAVLLAVSKALATGSPSPLASLSRAATGSRPDTSVMSHNATGSRPDTLSGGQVNDWVTGILVSLYGYAHVRIPVGSGTGGRAGVLRTVGLACVVERPLGTLCGLATY
jgi:hypothetical protein